MKPASPTRAMWLIAQLRLRRLWNMVAGFRFRPAKPGSRPPTRARKSAGWVLAGLIGIVMLASMVNVARQSIINMQCYLEPSSQCVSKTAGKRNRVNEDKALQELAARPLAPAVTSALALQISLLLMASILLPLGSKEIARADWDLEWLVTLPAKRSTLLWGRIFERTVANPTGWIVLTPVCSAVAWYCGMRWSAPAAGMAGAMSLMALGSMIRTIADTGLRMSLPASQLRNLQALTAILGMPIIYLGLAFGQMRSTSLVTNMASDLPAWLMWTPPGLLMQTLNASTLTQCLTTMALLVGQLALALWAGMVLLRYQLRHGVVASSSRETGRSPRAATARTSVLSRLMPRSPVKRRELQLLARDRNFLIQSLLLPLIIVGSQMIFSGSPAALAYMAARPEIMTGIGCGLATYMLMLSAFQTLNNEGESLWMLYTFPRSIESVLREKAQFWSVLALAYPVLTLVLGIWAAPATTLNALGMFAQVLLGVPLFAVIAVSLGVFACNPLAQDARSKIKPSYAYLYMLLSGMFIYAVTAAPLVSKLVIMVLLAALALALWQKARDHLPYLLDPVAAPPARVSTSDGLIAAVLFFALQALLVSLLTGWARLPIGEAALVAFSIAGLLVYAIVRLVYFLSKTTGIPVMFTRGSARGAGWGLGAGVVAGALGIGYLNAIMHWGLFPELLAGESRLAIKVPVLLALAVIAAPLAEEFIFRGLVFGGLRRSMGLAPSMVLSAALFAVVHPAASMVPVFVLGLGTAFVYDRTRSLLAPVLMHAVYNAAVVGYQVL